MTRDEGPPDAKALTGRPGPYDTDDACLVKNFLGKSRADFARMLRERKGFTAEDFYSMADPGLLYYLPEVNAYLRSEASKDDYDLAFFLTSPLHFRYEAAASAVKDIIKSIASYLRENRAKFGLNAEDPRHTRYFRDVLE